MHKAQAPSSSFYLCICSTYAASREAQISSRSAYPRVEVILMSDVQAWVGKQVEQVRAEAPEYQKHVGRKGTVEEAFEDEKGQIHVKTDDGMWCPVRLLSTL